MKEPIEAFRASGFLGLDCRISGDQIDELRSFASREMPEQGFSSVGGFELLERFPYLLFEVVLGREILGLANSILGTGARLNGCSLVKVPAATRSTLDWHRDIFGRVPAGGCYEHPSAINLLMYLQDLTDENGPLLCIPGSHSRPVQIAGSQKASDHADQIAINCEAGRAYIIHNNLVHSRGINRSDSVRLNLSFVFTPCYIKPNIDFDRPSASEIVSALASRGLRREAEMLGDTRRYRDLINSGFLHE